MSSNNTGRAAIKLPTSLHSSDGCIFVSPGWEDLPGSLPALGEGDEQSFFQIFLTELNNKFALQLDAFPKTDRTSQMAPDAPDKNCLALFLLGGATQLGSLTSWSQLTSRSLTPLSLASVSRSTQ
jgi:hypothetical protein